MKEINYYEQIKELFVNNEIKKAAKNYSINKSDLDTYYNVGEMLSEAGKKYGEDIIGNYSKRLKKELNKKYNERTLRRYRQFYNFVKNLNWSALPTNLSWSHITELMILSDKNEIDYYIDISIKNNLGYRELGRRIKSNEYRRLSEKTKEKLIQNEKLELIESVPDPIFIPSSIEIGENNIKEKLLKQLILENLDRFLIQLGVNYSYIGNEYKIKLDHRYYYIDLLLFNIEFNCYIVIELKVNELKKEDVGQIKFYMNYIDKKLKKENHDKTIGIILCKKGNDLVLEYTSDDRIISREYRIVNT